MNWKIVLLPRVERTLERLQKENPELFRRVLEKLSELQERGPYIPGVEKLKGWDNYYRVRVGKWRIVFKVVKEERLIVVTLIEHRETVYER